MAREEQFRLLAGEAELTEYRFNTRKQEEAQDSVGAVVVLLAEVHHLQPGVGNAGTYGEFEVRGRRRSAPIHLRWKLEFPASENRPADLLARDLNRAASDEFMKRVRDLGLHEKCYILVGVGPMASAKTAKWIRSNVPGIHIPDSVIARLEGAQDQKKEGKQLCIDIINEVKEVEGVAGIHVMAYRQEEYVSEIVHESGVLKGRTPWKRASKPDVREEIEELQEAQASGPIDRSMH